MEVQAELHCHTHYSDGWSSPAACVRVASRKGLQVLAITDHNTAEGGLSYWHHPLQEGVFVIPGEEISTDIGHVLAYFVRQTILPGEFETVIEQIRQQDAIAFLAHPYHIPLGNWLRNKRILKLEEKYLLHLQGLEIENGHNREAANRLALRYAHERGLPTISGSDAHFPFEIGNARTLLDLSALDYPSIYQALQNGWVRSLPRRMNGYPTYLVVAILNRLTRRRYAWKGT